jgi:hypothetical protein
MNSLWKKNMTFVDFNTLNTHTTDNLVIFAPRTTNNCYLNNHSAKYINVPYYFKLKPKANEKRFTTFFASEHSPDALYRKPFSCGAGRDRYLGLAEQDSGNNCECEHSRRQ